MSQYQKSYTAKINDQLSFVFTLANDVKRQVLSVLRRNKLDLQFVKLFQNMEYYLERLTPLDDDEEFQGFDYQHQQDYDFDRKSFAQIVGISQFDNTYQEEQDSQFFIEQGSVKYENYSSNNWSQVRGPYRSYRMEEKLKVIKLYQEGKNYAFISRYLDIPQKNIVRWCKNGVARKQGAGRKIGDEQMERKVLLWISQSFKKGEIINPKLIRQKAMQVSTKLEFKSSKGWLKNFIRRHDLNENYDIL